MANDARRPNQNYITPLHGMNSVHDDAAVNDETEIKVPAASYDRGALGSLKRETRIAAELRSPRTDPGKHSSLTTGSVQARG